MPETDDWFEIAPLPTALDHTSGAALGGRFYVIGGRQCGSNINCEARTDVQIYDPANDGWSHGAPMIMGCAGMGSGIVMNGRIYAIGGEGSSCTGTQVQEYDPLVDSWRLVQELPDPHHGIWPVRIGDPLDGIPDRVFVAAGWEAIEHLHALQFSCEECIPEPVDDEDEDNDEGEDDDEMEG